MINCKNIYSQRSDFSGICLYFANSLMKKLNKITIENNTGYYSALGIIFINEEKSNSLVSFIALAII